VTNCNGQTKLTTLAVVNITRWKSKPFR